MALPEKQSRRIEVEVALVKPHNRVEIMLYGPDGTTPLLTTTKKVSNATHSVRLSGGIKTEPRTAGKETSVPVKPENNSGANWQESTSRERKNGTITEKPRKQSKKTPVEAQKIWKELTHEERLNKRLKSERLKLISVLSQILDKTTIAREAEKQEAKKTESQVEKSIKRHEAKETKNQAWLQRQEAKAAELEKRVEKARLQKEEREKRIETEIAEREKKWAREDAAAALAEKEARAKKKHHHLREKIAGTIMAALVVGAAIFAARSCELNEGLPVPIPAAKNLPPGIVEYDFPTAIGSNAEVAELRGGNPAFWIRVEEEFLITRPKTDGTIEAVVFKKAEWRYDLNKGKMEDLKVHAMIPQDSQSAAAALELGSTADAYNLQPIRITHDKKSPQYAPWMNNWSMVPEGTIIGWHGIERKGNNGNIYDLNIPAGGVVEFYNDRGTVTETDDVAVTTWNPNSETIPSPQTMEIKAAGFTWWPWGNPEKIVLQQSNYQQNVNVPGAYASVADSDGKIHLIPLKVLSNIASPDAAHRYIVFGNEGEAVMLSDVMNIPPSVKN